MKRITQSATKLVLLMVTLTACIGFFMKLLSPELFMTVVSAVVGYYFGSSKGQKDDVNIPVENNSPDLFTLEK